MPKKRKKKRKIMEKIPKKRYGTKIYKYEVRDSMTGRFGANAYTLRNAKKKARQLANKTGHTHVILHRLIFAHPTEKRGK